MTQPPRCVIVSLSLAIMTFLAVTLQIAAQPTAKKLPIPNSEAVKRAAALIVELYGPEIQKAGRDRDLQLKLAQTLLFEARDTHDDPAGKLALLHEAARLASNAGEGALTLDAWDQVAASFDIPPADIFKLKVLALAACARATAAPEAYEGTLNAAKVLMEEAVIADDFENAVSLGSAAEAAAKKLKSVPLVSAIRKRNEEVKSLQAEYSLVKPFVEALKKDPSNTKANLEVGKYQALVRGNWDRGLPLLARGSDSVLKDLAAEDLANPKNWEGMSLLGAKWEKEGNQTKGAASVNALLRSYHWYQRAFASGRIEDKERASFQAAMLRINNLLPAELRAGEITAEVRRFAGHPGPVFGVAISTDGAHVASAGADGVVRLWDTRSGKELRRLEGHRGPVWAVCFSPDGKRVLSSGFDKRILEWDTSTGRSLYSNSGHGDYVRAVAVSGNGRFVLSGGDDRMVELWDTEYKPSVPNDTAGTKRLPGHDHYVFGVAISRDGKRGLSASLDRTVRLWDLEEGKTLKVLTGHADTVLAVAFTPDGQRAVSASTDKTLRLWDLKTGQTLRVYKGHTGYVLSVAVAPDGRRALSAGHDGKLLLWDLETGNLIRTLSGHFGPIWSVAYSGDGRLAVTAGNDGSVRLWANAK